MVQIAFLGGLLIVLLYIQLIFAISDHPLNPPLTNSEWILTLLETTCSVVFFLYCDSCHILYTILDFVFSKRYTVWKFAQRSHDSTFSNIDRILLVEHIVCCILTYIPCNMDTTRLFLFCFY